LHYKFKLYNLYLLFAILTERSHRSNQSLDQHHLAQPRLHECWNYCIRSLPISKCMASMWTVRESMKELFGVFRKINCKQGPFSNFLVVETTVQCFLNIVFCHIPAHLMELSRCFVPIIWDNVGVGDRRKRLSRSFAPTSRQETCLGGLRATPLAVRPVFEKFPNLRVPFPLRRNLVFRTYNSSESPSFGPMKDRRDRTRSMACVR